MIFLGVTDLRDLVPEDRVRKWFDNSHEETRPVWNWGSSRKKMRSFNISIKNQLIRGELKDFLLSQIFTLGTDSFQKDALAWTDLPGAPAGLSGGSCEILPCLTFESGSERAASPVFQAELLSLAKQCDLPVRKVEKWFRRRRNMDRPSLSKKFSEAWWAGAQAMNVRFSPELSSTDSSLPPSALYPYTERS